MERQRKKAFEQDGECSGDLSSRGVGGWRLEESCIAGVGDDYCLQGGERRNADAYSPGPKAAYHQCGL